MAIVEQTMIVFHNRGWPGQAGSRRRWQNAATKKPGTWGSGFLV